MGPPCLLSPEAQEVTASSGKTCTVTSAADSGPGTLRECLQNAGSGDTIAFDQAVFPPHGPTTIRLISGLPHLSQGGQTIDGSNAGVILDGSGTPPGTYGLYIDSDHNVVKGLQVLHFPSDGVFIGGGAYNTIGGDRTKGNGPLGEGNVISGNGGAGLAMKEVVGNRVIGNFIGLDASGKALLSNGPQGVVIALRGGGNIIGGPSPADRNVISNNGVTAVRLIGASGNTVMGNYIGTDASGQVQLGHSRFFTVVLDLASANNRIEGNVIAGDVHIGDPGSSYNEVVGNYIGVDATGTAALGRGGVIVNVPFTRIGGTTARERNVIVGGVQLGSGLVEATDMLFLGNYVGTDVTGTRAIGRGKITIGGRHNFVGGTTLEERNIVVGGVSIIGGADYNFVAGNYIGTDVTGTVALPNFVGISVQDAEHNAIQANLISGSEAAGVTLSQGANFNWLRANRVTQNKGIGIGVADGEGNRIVGNSLIDNGQNGVDDGRNNRWDDGKQGNYWSDYQGVDADGDGTGDMPYPIPPNGEDRYPIMAQPQPP